MSESSQTALPLSRRSRQGFASAKPQGFSVFLPASLEFGVWDLELWRLLVAQASPLRLCASA
jgi:hypothetical protein